MITTNGKYYLDLGRDAPSTSFPGFSPTLPAERTRERGTDRRGPWEWGWCVTSMEFLHSFLRCHFPGNQCRWRREMSAVFSEQCIHFDGSIAKHWVYCLNFSFSSSRKLPRETSFQWVTPVLRLYPLLVSKLFLERARGFFYCKLT